MRHRHLGYVAACGAVFVMSSTPALAGDGVKTAGEILRIALPVAAGGFSLYKRDYDGVLQLTVSEVIAEGTSLVLQHFIKEQRPDKSDWHSFPSDSAAVAFSAASYLQIRYGWDYGLPAYAVAAFVGYSRVEADKHHWRDVVAGAVLGWAASEITTIRYRNFEINATPGFAETPLGFSVSARW
ncbi:MAG TPA: phosphatase PAP2 family protein [Micropepsaceae bacterium]|nr:phosphatase PAP2 family protein [Micropepsaceae bacterium]